MCAVFTGVPTKTEDSFVSAILSGHCIVACVACCARWSLKFLLRPPQKNCNVPSTLPLQYVIGLTVCSLLDQIRRDETERNALT